MIQFWRRRMANGRLHAAQEARRDAEERYQEALARWKEVNDVVRPLKEARGHNHFADLFPMLGGGRR